MPFARAVPPLLLIALVMAVSTAAGHTSKSNNTAHAGGSANGARSVIATDPPSHLSACTVTAAETYLRQRPHQHADPSATPATITAILAANGICSVILRGTFVVSGPPTPAQNTTLIGDSGHLLFDARTGALLTVGVGGLERVMR